MDTPSLVHDHWYTSRWDEMKDAIHGTSVEQELHADPPPDEHGYRRLRERAAELEREIEAAEEERDVLHRALSNNDYRWMLAGQQRYGGTRKHYEKGFSPWSSDYEEEEVDA
jgi:hypothetical protein